MSVETSHFRNPEVLAKPPETVLLLGAGSGLGFTLAQQMSLDGYQVYAGTRSHENFQRLMDSVSSPEVVGNVVSPKPFIADIRNPAEVDRAFDESGLPEGQRIHLLPLAAGGMEPIITTIGLNMARLERKVASGSITIEDLEKATDKIRRKTTSPEALEYARKINVIAQLDIIDRLIERGNLGKGSLIFNTSSSLSHNCDPDHPENFPGPWFYYSIGMSKQEGVMATRERAREIGATHIDVVSPEISDTDIGRKIEEMADIARSTPGVGDFEVPHVTRDMVARNIKLLIAGGSDFNGQSMTVFVNENGIHTFEQPEEWVNSPVPYF